MPDDRLPVSVPSLPAAVGWWAARTPQASALLPGHESGFPVSFAELHARAGALAACLKEAGIGRSDLVAIDADPPTEAVVAMVAAMSTGAALPLIPGASNEALGAVFARLRPAVCLVADRAGAAAHAARAAHVPVLSLGAECESAPSAAAPSGDDVALVLHSSGTTGRPRGIPRTHRNLLCAASSYVAWAGHENFARVLATTPLSFGMGAHTLCATLCAGGAVVLPGRPPEEILRAIGRWRPTWGYVVPALLEAMVEEAEQAGVPTASDWRVLGTAGMAPASGLAERVRATFGVALAEGYGCGEAGLIAGTTRAKMRVTGTMDRVFTTGIATLDARDEPTPPGTPGEIVVWGPQVSSGYLRDPEAMEASFDAAGALRLVGRVKEIINRGGEKIAPAEIDAALMAHPGVAEAAAFALPHLRLGEDVAAALVLREPGSVSQRELRRWVANRLSLPKIPRHIWFVDALPRTGSGKVQRGELARRFGETRDA